MKLPSGGRLIKESVEILQAKSPPTPNDTALQLPAPHILADSAGGLAFDTRSCDDSMAVPRPLLQPQFNVSYTEGFGASFKKRVASTTNNPPDSTDQDPGMPGTVYNTESGFVNSAALGPGIGTATQGTRLMARFQNLPAGFPIWVTTGPIITPDSPSSSPTTVAGSGQRQINAVLTQADSDGSGDFLPVDATDMMSCPELPGQLFPVAPILTLPDGSATATWEITDADSTAVEKISFGVWVLPAPGTGSVKGNLAPISDVGVLSDSAPEPRFLRQP